MKAILVILALAAAVGIGWYLFGGNTPAANTANATTQPAATVPIPAPTPKKAEEKPVADIAGKIKPAGKGALKGIAKYVGTAPVLPPKPLPPGDHAGCHAKEVPDESLLVDPKSNGIRWVMVRIINVEFQEPVPIPATPPQMDQAGCIFSPHVVIVPPGTDLEVLNPQAISHNFRTIPLDFLNPERNLTIGASMPKLVYVAKDLAQPEIVQVQCNIHGWMKAFIVVHDPRSCAVTGMDGAFEIKDLPAGKYKVNLWHEKLAWYLGKELHDVEIKSGETTDMGELKFEPKK